MQNLFYKVFVFSEIIFLQKIFHKVKFVAKISWSVGLIFFGFFAKVKMFLISIKNFLYIFSQVPLKHFHQMFPLFFVFQKVIALIMFKILCVVFSQICLKSFLQNNFMIFFKNFFAPAIF